jgi:energy-coupling factor transporter ATP-binding protein EcfA2
MANKYYQASVQKPQGREYWTISFRHPVRTDRDGKPGLKVQRGLATSDETEAKKLEVEMNELLASPELWQPSSQPIALRRYDERVVTAFYDTLVPNNNDFVSLREEAIPLPSVEDGYKRILLLGTTGVGKTTLLRQLLGTKPRENFPSTSTARTTVADMEFIFAPGEYRAVVTFMPKDQVREYVEDCILAAALQVYRKATEENIRRHFLSHVDQSFRMNYILGNGRSEQDIDDGDLDDDESGFVPLDTEIYNKPNLEKTNAVIQECLSGVNKLVAVASEKLKSELGPISSDADAKAMEEIIEEELDRNIRSDPYFDKIVESLMVEIKERFDLIGVGEIQKTKQGWPLYWIWSEEKRENFVKVVNRFSSNYSPFFGTLLTPLVNGIRVRGPFQPNWLKDSTLKFVIYDGKGLDHIPGSSLSLPSAIYNKFDDVDSILLVDNATQPMQSSTIAVLRQLIASGHESKLSITFTHFDEVRGPNLPTFLDKRQHVIESLENAIKSVGADLGPSAGRSLGQIFEQRSFCVGSLHKQLEDKLKNGQRYIDEIKKLLLSIHKGVENVNTDGYMPVYDATNLVFKIQKATINFHDRWSSILGLSSKSGIKQEHWSRIKALSRRYATQWEDQYDNLRPVGDLRMELVEAIRQFIESPLQWTPFKPSDDIAQAIFSNFAQEINRGISKLVSDLLFSQPVAYWDRAYYICGRGSKICRANLISTEIYNKSVPIPNDIPSVDRTTFLQKIRSIIQEASAKCKAKLV